MIDILEEVQDVNFEERYKLATKTTSLDELRLMAQDTNNLVRYGVATNKNIDKELMLELTKDRNVSVRNALAERSDVPIDILDILSKDKIATVKRTIAMNPNVSTETLLNMIEKENLHIKYLIFENQYRDELIVSLLENKDFKVVYDVLMNNDISEKTKDSFFESNKYKDVRLLITDSRYLSKELLDRLSNDKDVDVRFSIALNDTPNYILKKLAFDSDDFVKTCVAQNKNAEEDTLELLSKDSNWRTRLAVLMNDSVSKRIVETLSKDENIKVSKIANEKLNELNSSNNDLDMLDFADQALDKSNTQEIEKSKSKFNHHNH